MAQSCYAGKGALRSVSLLQGPPPLEIQAQQLPVWRADFDDGLETSLYIDPNTGALVTRRHRFWALVRFLLDASHDGLSEPRQLQQSTRDCGWSGHAVACAERVLAALP